LRILDNPLGKVKGIQSKVEVDSVLPFTERIPENLFDLLLRATTGEGETELFESFFLSVQSSRIENNRLSLNVWRLNERQPLSDPVDHSLPIIERSWFLNLRARRLFRKDTGPIDFPSVPENFSHI